MNIENLVFGLAYICLVLIFWVILISEGIRYKFPKALIGFNVGDRVKIIGDDDKCYKIVKRSHDFVGLSGRDCFIHISHISYWESKT